MCILFTLTKYFIIRIEFVWCSFSIKNGTFPVFLTLFSSNLLNKIFYWFLWEYSSADWISTISIHVLYQKYRDFEIGFILINLIRQKTTRTTNIKAFLFLICHNISMRTLFLPDFLLILFKILIISFNKLFIYETNWSQILFLFTFWFTCFCSFRFIYWLIDVIFLAWTWLAEFHRFRLGAFVDSDWCCHVLIVSIETDFFLLLYFIRVDHDTFFTL